MQTIYTQPRYMKMIANGSSWQDIVDAGYIEEPYPTVPVGLPEINGNGIILLLTGCFAPIHSGHIQSMKAAKAHLEASGAIVAAGLFSFCHDDYVSTKTPDWPINRRIAFFNDHPDKEDWMHGCEYESANTCALNFTTVYDAIKDYYKQPIVLICGSDNTNFYKVFNKDEQVIVFVRESKDVGTVPDNVTVLPSPLPSMASSKIRS